LQSLVKLFKEKDPGGKRRGRADGGNNPIRIQSMTTIDTMDTLGSGGTERAGWWRRVRIREDHCPSIKEAQNLAEIKKRASRQGPTMFTHRRHSFHSKRCRACRALVEKVRVNPGNYADKKKFEEIDYTDLSYEAELERIRAKSPRW